jgi:hypothetical protein
VARLHLMTSPDFYTSYLYPGTRPPTLIDIPNYKLYLHLYAVPPDQRPGWRPDDALDPLRRFSAMVDTGASISSLPFHVWSRFEPDIRWLDRVDDVPIRFGGETYPYRLGRVLLAAIDLDGRWLPPDWALVRCLDDAPEPIPALLGLQSPFLTHRRLLRHTGHAGDDPELTAPDYWLEDA